MGHLGMTPQTASQLGGYKVQGKTEKEAAQILRDARALEKAGVFAVVLECVPSGLAATVTKALKIPTIGIGAGQKTDGQVLVLHDALGFHSSVKPRFVRRYMDMDSLVRKAIKRYAQEVRNGNFPSKKESFT